MGFHLAPEIEEGVTIYANDERRQEWRIALDELNEVAAERGRSLPEVSISWRDEQATLTRGCEGEWTLDKAQMDPLFVRYRDSIRRVSRVCASGRAGADEIRRLDDRKRQAHNGGAEGLMALLTDQIPLDEDTARRLFSLLFLLWDHGLGPEVRLHHR